MANIFPHSENGVREKGAVHSHFSLTEAFLVLSVNSLALQGGRNTIENALF
jgi:hypothetical protein